MNESGNGHAAAPEAAERRTRSAPPTERPFIHEMVIIVASILIAFALDASWDAWRRASDRANNRDALREEFVANRGIVERGLVRHVSIQTRLAGLLETVATSPRGMVVTVPDSILSAMFEWRTQDWATGTVQAFLASDGLQQLTDQDLRAWIGSWAARIQDVNEDQELARDYVNNVVSVLCPSDSRSRISWNHGRKHSKDQPH